MSIVNTLRQFLKTNNQIHFLKKEGVLEWVFNDQAWIATLTKEREKEWGSFVTNSTTVQWTTKLSEQILYEILLLQGKNPTKITKGKTSINGKMLLPDFETNDALYESKARCYTVKGTAGEKILGTPIKYRECKSLFNKPLFIVCMGYQETEAQESFGLFDNDCQHMNKILNFYKQELGITYIKATDMLLNLVEPQLQPVLKWAGGKRSIMNTLTSYFPRSFHNYHEPFLGGMSVFMELYNKGIFVGKRAYLSDVCTSLINVYTVIKNSLPYLKNELQKEDYKNTKESFLEKRKRFNSLKKKIDENSTELAAIFLYLNKTCFNGMYRENKNGDYNVPFGYQSNPNIFNEVLITNLHKALNHENINLSCGNYNVTFDKALHNDFFYLDPPYYDTFTSYTKESFGEKEQVELSEYFQLLTAKGCKVALSNSNTDFIKKLYNNIPNTTIHVIPVRRNIKNCDTTSELLITNYLR